jgi:hypothetical protein
VGTNAIAADHLRRFAVRLLVGAVAPLAALALVFGAVVL